MKQLFLILLLISVCSCNYVHKKRKTYVETATVPSLVTQVEKEPTVVRGKRSYFTNDTLYVLNEDSTMMLKIKCSVPFSPLTDVFVEDYTMNDYLFIGIIVETYAVKSFIVSLRRSEIVVETEGYNTYYGTSPNGLFHILADCSCGTGCAFSVFGTNNCAIVKHVICYGSVPIKWVGNKFYYFGDIDNESDRDSLKRPLDDFMWVQRYEWENGHYHALREFQQVMVGE